MYSIREWLETEKSKKNAEWGNTVIRMIRQVWQPLISQQEAEVGMSYLLGYQNMDFIKNLFINATRINLTNQNTTGIVNGFGQPVRASTEHDLVYLKEMQSLDFKPLPIMEKLKNVLIAEMKKMGAIVNVRSEDPTSVAKKIKDKGLLENRRILEGLFSYAYTSIGQRPFNMKDYEARFGEKPDNGNTGQFDAMGLEPGDPEDIDFFMNNFHKLDEEIAAESPINYFMNYNRVMLQIEKWVNDIIAKKACAAECYVSDVTGAIMYKYLAPETVFIYGGGNEKDFNDANAKGYERKVTIKELLDILGNKFDMEREFNNLLMAITNTEKIEWTGVAPSYRGFVAGNDKLSSRAGKNYSYNDFMAFRVTLGKIEFNSQNQETFGTTVKDDAGFYQNNQSITGKYPGKARWETPTYKAYYLAISTFDQILFDFGELPYQDILGSSDFSVTGTIVTYKEIGDPIAIQAAQIIDMVNEAWYKFRYELRRAKPRGRGWNYDSMVSTLMDLIPDTTSSSFNKLQKVMEMLDSSANEIYSFPKDADGKAIQLPGNQINYDIPNGMSKESMLWWEIMMNGIQYLSDMIGIAPLREGDPGNPRDSMNNQFKALEYSQASTYYIPDMLTYLFRSLAIKTNFYTQDIITYKSHNTVAYKFLEDGIGEETILKIEKLGKTALHRFGIFVESLNQAPLRQKLEGVLFEAVKNKTISTAQYLLISDEKSIKKAFLTFAFFEQRNKKLAQKSAMELQQHQQESQMQQTQMMVSLEKMKQDTIILKAQIEANAGQQEHLINQQGGITKTKMKLDGDISQIYHAAYADFIQQSKLLNDTGKNTPPPPPAPLPAGAGNNGAVVPQDASQAQQLRDNATPQPTSGAMA